MPKLNPDSLHGLKRSDMYSADHNCELSERTRRAYDSDLRFKRMMIKAGYFPTMPIEWPWDDSDEKVQA